MPIELFDYQKEAIELFEEKPLNLSDVGVGKTFMALGSFKRSKCHKLLVVGLAPKVQDFAEDGKLMDLEITPLNKGTKKNKELLKESNMVSVSFNSVWRLEEFNKWVDDDTFIIIDESHKVGVTSSKVTKFVMKLSRKAKYSYLLTATPVSNGKLENWYSQLYIANVFRKTKKEFEDMFVVKQLRQMGSMRFMDIVGYKNEHLLQQMIDNHSVNYKRDKPYIPQDVVYKTKKPTMYNKLKKERMYQGTTELHELETSSALFNALRCVSHGFLYDVDKVISKEPFERLEAILESHNDERVVIFYNYNAERDALIKFLTKLKRPISQYNGSVKDLSAFKHRENGVVLCHYKSASTGINDLVISNIIIYNSLPLSSVDYLQSKGRIDRHGQDKTPIYYYIIPDTPQETKIYQTVVIDGKDIDENTFEEY